MEWPLHFNISHTSSLIACGITMDTLIGIDVEDKKRKTAKNILSLARRYFTPSEIDYLAKIPDPDGQQMEFIKLWTLKESYVKALGRGFSGAPFNKFSIILATNDRIQISVVYCFPCLYSCLSSLMCATCKGTLQNYICYAFEHNLSQPKIVRQQDFLWVFRKSTTMSAWGFKTMEKNVMSNQPPNVYSAMCL